MKVVIGAKLCLKCLDVNEVSRFENINNCVIKYNELACIIDCIKNLPLASVA